VTRHLQNTYDYNANGVLSTYTPIGQEAWTLTYTTLPADSGIGRLASVTRSALSAGTATTTVVYSVPLSGTGAPNDLSVGQTARWGQSQAPVDATAVFDPGEIPTGNQSTGTLPADYNRATVTYMDSNGREVNTARPGGGVDTTWYDGYGNVVQSLTGGNRQLALNTSTTDTAVQEAAIAARESTTSVYSADGQQELQTLGPEHEIVLGSGPIVRGRVRTTYTYDEGAPSGGPYNLVTTTVEDNVYKDANGNQVSAGARTTTDGYDWNLRRQIVETVDPSGLALATRTTYDTATGQVATTTAPAGGTTTNTPQTRVTVYYTAAANGTYPECGGHPEWAQMSCREQVGGQAASGPEIPVKVTTYNIYGAPRVITEKTSAGVQRTSTMTYDVAGRLSSVVYTTAAGLGTAVPTTRTTYDQASGQATLTQSLDANNNVTAQVQRAYDTLGRMYSYTDADGNVTTTTYDLFSRTATTNDSKGTRTWTYDGGTERRGLATSVLDSQAGTFTASYDIDGNAVSQSWPDNIVVTNGYNETGDATSIAYTQPGCGQANCTLYTQTVSATAHGQTQSSSSSLSGQVYSYDSAGRLTTVNDTVAGSCTTRTYTFNTATDRTGRSVYGPASDGSCQSSTASSTTNWSYDTADRISTGYTYDALGRATVMPGGDTETPALGNDSIGYYTNNMVQSLTQGDRTTTYTLDVISNRTRSWNDNSAGVTKTNHYSDDNDSPTWTDEGNSNMSRVIRGVVGVADIFTNTTGNVWQLSNLHGDLLAGITETGTGLAYTSEYNEYGQARNSADAGARRYGWLGQNQRAADTPGGLGLMGSRLYSPTTGRFTSVDPVTGGNANAYDYCHGDGINCTDVSGQVSCNRYRTTYSGWWWSTKRMETWFHCSFNNWETYLIIIAGVFFGSVLAAFGELISHIPWPPAVAIGQAIKWIGILMDIAAGGLYFWYWWKCRSQRGFWMNFHIWWLCCWRGKYWSVWAWFAGMGCN
jgi:RHS repeat-associated protein